MKLFKKNVLIIGAGNFGTAIASSLQKVSNVTVHTRSVEICKSINEYNYNSIYLSNIELKNVQAIDKIDHESLKRAHYIFICIPSKVVLDFIRNVKNIYDSSNDKDGILKNHFILCNKGISIGGAEKDFFSETIESIIPDVKVSVFSGPSFADEVANLQEAIVTIASKNHSCTKEISSLFKKTNISIVETQEITGTQLCGTFKNVMAINVAIAFQKHGSKNEMVKIWIEMLEELKKIMQKMSINTDIIISPAGVGDMMLSCFDKKSRNFNFGYEIASGKKVIELIKNNTVEGYHSTKSFYLLAKKYKVSVPIITDLYKKLYEE